MRYFKQIIILFFLIINFNINGYILANDILSIIENNIYGYDYSHDKKLNRVNRLEKTIYGKVSSGDINNRIKKLSGDISADVIGLEIKPSRDTFSEEENIEENNGINYPIVNEIEQKLFNTIYNNRDFHTRIVTIEKKLFGKIYDVDDYSKRMERIKAKMYPEIIDNNKNYNAYNIYNNENLKRKIYKPLEQHKYIQPYSNYGDNQESFQSENLYDDLTQMEYDMFGTEFSTDDMNTRIKRLNSANKAKKTSKKYDSQKFQQKMSTAMEIGAMILMILAMVL